VILLTEKQEQMSKLIEKVTVEEGVKELIIREGKANDVHIPNAMTIGELTIEAVREYLSKKGIEGEEIQNSYVWYSTEGDKPFIQLFYAVRREKPDNIHGCLIIDNDLKKFGINSGTSLTTFDLANFIRLNRHYFESKETAMSLVKELSNFKAKVDKEIENANDNRGNAHMMIKQKVISNVPLDFTLFLPIFKGLEKVAIKCEIDINAADLSCSLVSPDLKELFQVESSRIINYELEEIKKLYPELRIFRG
jgi:hypothetical protein